MKEIYEQEFDLNLKYQISKLNDIYLVGYQIDNIILFTIIIPKNKLGFKLK